MSIRNRLFSKNGHDCVLPHPLEDMYMFKPSTNILTQIKNILIRFRMASELNFRTQSYMRSQKNVDLEHRRHFKFLYIIHPFSDFRKYWEIFMIIVLFCQVIMIPLEVSFYKLVMISNFTESSLWIHVRIIYDLICLADVVTSFLTGYCDEKRNVIVLNPKKIAVHYILTYFIPDLLSSIPTAFENRRTSSQNTVQDCLTYMSLLKLLRIISLMRYCKHFCQLQHNRKIINIPCGTDSQCRIIPVTFIQSNGVKLRICDVLIRENYAIDYSWYKISVLLTLYLLYLHIGSCITIFVATSFTGRKSFYTVQYNASRLDMPYNLLRDVSTTYFYLLYETIRLVNNSGRLGISGEKKTGYTITMWFLSRLFYMYMTSLIIDVIIAKSSSIQKYFELQSELRDYMEHKHIPPYLQKRLLQYFEYSYQKRYFREAEILSTISGQLKQEVVLHSCRKLVENVDFFKNLPTSLLVRIVTNLRLETFMTNDVILKCDSIGDCMYFIATGTVAIYTKSGREIRHLLDGDHFGEIALVTINQSKRIASVLAVEPCELYKLERKDFVHAILPYPDLLMKIERIASYRMEETADLEGRKA